MAWELNYRGERLFLQQARAQAARRHLKVEDGWHYFVIGWAHHVATIFHFNLTPELLAQFSKAASQFR